MSMSHKAFIFEWRNFEAELLPLLAASLVKDSPEKLVEFVNRNLNCIVDPYEGNLLPENWLQTLDEYDVHEVGDYALTKYYDPLDDGGVAEEWLNLTDELSDECQLALLGKPVGEEDNYFDAGKMGSYFQTEEMVKQSHFILKAQVTSELESYVALLQRALELKKGLYVTF